MEASGLSLREFCDRLGIAVATFSYWRRRLRELAKVGTATESPSQLVAVRLKDPVGTSGGWIFRLVGGIELLPPEDFVIEDPAAMARARHAWKP